MAVGLVSSKFCQHEMNKQQLFAFDRSSFHFFGGTIFLYLLPAYATNNTYAHVIEEFLKYEPVH